MIGLKKLTCLFLCLAIGALAVGCKSKIQSTTVVFDVARAEYNEEKDIYSLILAGQEMGQVVSLSLGEELKPNFAPEAPTDIVCGDSLEIVFSGEYRESFPLELDQIECVNVYRREKGLDFGISEIYLEALEKEILEEESINKIALDLNKAEGISPGMKSAICYLFDLDIRENDKLEVYEMSIEEAEKNGFFEEENAIGLRLDSNMESFPDELSFTIQKTKPNQQGIMSCYTISSLAPCF